MRFLPVLVLKGISSLTHSKRETTDGEEAEWAKQGSCSAALLSTV